MPKTPVRYAATAALLLALTACGADGNEPEATPATKTSDTAPTTAAAPGETVTARPTTNLLDWTQVDVGKEVRMVTDKELIAVIARGGGSVHFSPHDVTVRAGEGRRIADVLLSSEYAVVVAEDDLEERPMSFTVLRNSTGATRELPGQKPTPGGPVTLSGDELRYPMIDDGRYCLVTLEIGSMRTRISYCAPPRHGFSNVTSSPSGTALMTFDDQRPVSCRTLVTLADDDTVTPLDGPPLGPPECKGWDVLATPDGAVWSTLPREQQVERGDFFAASGGQLFALGTGTTGSLTWCGDSAYFTRDAQKGGNAQLLRWTPEHTLEIVYASPGRGEAFLEAPRCAGSQLTLSAYGEGGDEQVSATVPG